MYDHDRRRHVRMRALKAASLILDNKQSTFDCVIRNLSEAGARIALETTINLPDRFFVQLSDGTRRHCEVRWRLAKELGVSFDAAEGQAA
ncbi:PilZ domain-containing protein [Ciceribacter sp. L1K23]|uniref:PilZ domain-containing protein n=1 Tax=Ciceribacter sp. L1K23 TaxID=2820276 RepID=UPI001B82ACB8|nr:PilZ domain-containing protein [Ciceribacter sp. L1K23]MBR0555857.1 PilZ domain-containing protein [Ciceribacter sp. L1K23]